jgi:hypothetical protein
MICQTLIQGLFHGAIMRMPAGGEQVQLSQNPTVTETLRVGCAYAQIVILCLQAEQWPP